jgi:signal transduction histidine kinase
MRNGGVCYLSLNDKRKRGLPQSSSAIGEYELNREMDMSGDSAKKQGMPYFLIVKYVLVIIVFSALLFIVSSALNLAEGLFQLLQKYASLHLSELIIVSIFLVFALAVLAGRLWHELKKEMQDRKFTETSLDRATTRLAFLNSITSQDILNQLTELSGELERDGQRTDIVKVKTAITRIHRQIKFIKEYQDIGASPSEWQNVPDTIMRARVGVNMGKVTVDVEMKNVEIFADRLLEKAFYYMIDNALKHGGEKLSRIRFSDRTLDKKLIIVCEDDGIGIPPDKRGSLFPDTYGRHIGYGLFFIKEILATTGISIKETGIPGKGARFEINVPYGAHR